MRGGEGSRPAHLLGELQGNLLLLGHKGLHELGDNGRAVLDRSSPPALLGLISLLHRQIDLAPPPKKQRKTKKKQ